jgi:tetratricopeptide (TPR) repeat protein
MPWFATFNKRFLTCLAILATAVGLRAADSPNIFLARAEARLQAAQKNFAADKANSTNALQFARACFDVGEIATNATQRADVSRLGIAACQSLLAREPKSAPGHYCLALNLGELADAEAPSLAAYKLVHEIEQEFITAARLDQHYDYAGAPRCLGLLYREAPGWPLSIGSKHKAREWLDRAAALAPDYPENFINLAEAHLRWRQADEAAAALKKLDVLWPSARTNLVGVTWEKSWSDWTRQRMTTRAEFQKVFKRTP